MNILRVGNTAEMTQMDAWNVADGWTGTDGRWHVVDPGTRAALQAAQGAELHPGGPPTPPLQWFVRSGEHHRLWSECVLELEDERLWQYPWIYIVEPSNLQLRDTEVQILREFLLRGGTLTMDDFHGPYEWDLTVRQLRRVFPDREIVELEPPHPIFSCFYRIEKYPQIPGLGSFFSGRTWEKGGFQPHLRAILDDAGRPMVLINWNTDMGDGVEWSNAEDYPGYIKWTALAYQMMINEVIYSLTH